MKLAKITTKMTRIFNRHLPNILTIAGVAGVGLTVYASVKAAAKIETCVAVIKATDNSDEIHARTIDILKEVSVPTIIGAGTVASIIASNRVSSSRINQLVNSYRSLRHDYTNYKLAAAGVLGSEGRKKIEEFLDRKNIVEHPVESKTNDGTFIFVDRFTNITFRSTVADVAGSIYALNRAFSMRGYASLKEYCKLLDIPVPDDFKNFGWDYDIISNMFNSSWLDFLVESHDDGEGGMYYTITMLIEPEPDGYESYGWFTEDYNAYTDSYLIDDRDSVIGKIDLPFDKD